MIGIHPWYMLPSYSMLCSVFTIANLEFALVRRFVLCRWPYVISAKVTTENLSLLDALLCNVIFLFMSYHHLNVVYGGLICLLCLGSLKSTSLCFSIQISKVDSISQWTISLICPTTPPFKLPILRLYKYGHCFHRQAPTVVTLGSRLAERALSD